MLNTEVVSEDSAAVMFNPKEVIIVLDGVTVDEFVRTDLVELPLKANEFVDNEFVTLKAEDSVSFEFKIGRDVSKDSVVLVLGTDVVSEDEAALF